MNNKINEPQSIGDILANAAKTAEMRVERLRNQRNSDGVFEQAVQMRDLFNNRWSDYMTSLAD